MASESYRGTTIIKVGAEENEFLSLEFADHDKVYVPIDALHLVQKYLGAGGEIPALSKLGSGTWNRTKRRVKVGHPRDCAGTAAPVCGTRGEARVCVFA